MNLRTDRLTGWLWSLAFLAVLGLLCLLFASSLCIVYVASTAGYFDHILVALAALGVLQRGVLARAVLLLAGGAAAILIH